MIHVDERTERDRAEDERALEDDTDDKADRERARFEQLAEDYGRDRG